MSESVLTDDELTRMYAVSQDEVEMGHRIEALVRERLAERLLICPFHPIDCHEGCGINRHVAAAIVRGEKP